MPPLEQPWPRSHYDLLRLYQAQYDESIRSGEFDPFVYPWGAYGALVVIIYMLIPHRHRPWLRKARFLVFAWIAGFAAYTIRYTRARAVAPAFGIGLISAWSVLWVMAILVARDAEVDFQRIERMEGVFKGDAQGRGGGREKSLDGSLSRDSDGCNEGHSNGHAEPREHLGPSQRHGEFAWQAYPLTPFIERLDWVLDLFCNFRGVGWNWRTSSLPPPPQSIQQQLRRNSPNPPPHSTRVHPGQPYTYPTRRALLLGNLRTFITGYFILDALKTAMNHDPYFWGLVNHNTPLTHLPPLFSKYPILLRMYRLALSQFGVQWALKTAFSLGPLFFSGLLGPRLIGARAEPWMYPETWGPYSMVLDRGLAGWWSGWWHQTFRFAFERREFVAWVGLGREGPLARLLTLVIAFGLSGLLHACGSYTSLGPTRPIRGPMAFFLLQAVGVFFEALLTHVLRGTMAGDWMRHQSPRWVRRTCTFAYVYIWFLFTAPLLCDDFATGGVWLLEPIPVSLLRGLGFGVEGDGWWCWGDLRLVRWVGGRGLWRSGLAF